MFKLDQSIMELTSLCLYEKFVLQQSLEYLANVLLMLGRIPGEDQDIIQVNEHKPICHRVCRSPRLGRRQGRLSARTAWPNIKNVPWVC